MEGDETFTVALGAVSGLASGVPGGAGLINQAGSPQTGTITNDDSSTLTITSPTVTEGTSGIRVMTFIVTSPNAVVGGFTVDFSVANGTATSGSDFNVVTTGPLTFTGAANETRTISVNILSDALVEGPENFTVTLGTVTTLAIAPPVASGNVVSGAVGTGTINDPLVVSNLSTGVWTKGLDIPVGAITMEITNGTSPYSVFSVSSSLTTLGLSAVVNGSTISIIGKPKAAGVFTNLQVTIIDASGAKVTKIFTLTINNPITFTWGTNLPFFFVGKSYNLNLNNYLSNVKGGTGARTFTYAVSGAGSAGLTLDSTSGLLFGKPTSTGPIIFTVTATDSLGAVTTFTLTKNTSKFLNG